MSVRARLGTLRERLRASLWLAPTVATLGAVAAAKGLIYADHVLQLEDGAWYLFGGQADSARAVLGTISASMITFTGLVFSITILVLQLASSQFSPRVLRTFLDDRGTHVAMGTFVGTFVFALVVLADVRENGFVPGLSVFTAFSLVLLSVGVFIHYINHMGHAVRAVNILKRVSRETRRSIEHMYPDAFIDAAHDDPARTRGAPTSVIENDRDGGVVTAVDEDVLMRVARDADCLLVLVPMPGDFVPRGAPLFRVWGGGSGGESLDPDELRDAVALGDERTPHQDPAFGFRQLVDIAERALSPGTNDPSTAVQALDEIHDLLRMLARRRFPSPERIDEAGRLRLILPRPDWPTFVHLALDEIRDYGEGSVQVVRRLRALIEDCLSIAPPSRRTVLEEQLRLLDARNGELPAPDRTIARRPSMQGHGHA